MLIWFVGGFVVLLLIVCVLCLSPTPDPEDECDRPWEHGQYRDPRGNESCQCHCKCRNLDLQEMQFDPRRLQW